ncbi:MAG: UMP kinase [Patescibacteria group bacterium]|mgnify:CR=1 FL=1
MAIFVLSVGGSTVVPNGKVNAIFLKSLKALVARRAVSGDRFVMIIGGGGTCRVYNDGLRRAMHPTKTELDWLGIYTTHLNAQLVRLIFGKLAHPTLANDNKAFDLKSWKAPVVLGGGHKPGGSTDTNMILFARKFRVKEVINISNVDYLYTKDPRKFKDAKKIEQISWKDYRQMIGKKREPGMNIPFDPVASRLAHASKIRVMMVGSDIKNLECYFSGKSFKGSVIS